MDSLKNLVANVPDWVKRLDDLSGQIEQRQIELAKFAEANPPVDPSSGTTAPKSVRNKGSTESLKPTDEPSAHPDPIDVAVTATEMAIPTTAPLPPPLFPDAVQGVITPAAAPTSAPAPTSNPMSPPPLPSASVAAVEATDVRPMSVATDTPSAIQRQTNQVIAAAQAKARATLRKRNRSDSVVSAEGAAVKYRSRTLVLVYYDSYVQSFFEELVKFVSASRNLMRKAKMAAKVAQIKRMAELELPGNEDGEDGELKADSTKPVAPKTDGTGDDDAIPALSFTNIRQMRGPYGAGMMRPSFARAATRGAYGGGAGFSLGPQKPDGFDAIDKGLEYVQSMCEHGAHQFLRDGDCNEEIEKIKARLSETHELANKEMERILKDDPDAANESAKSRSYRLQSMRRETTPVLSAKEAAAAAAAAGTSAASPLTSSKSQPPPMNNNNGALEVDKLEVDEGIEDVDYDTMPKLVYKSTRLMRNT